MAETIAHIICGPPEHGVSRYARHLLHQLTTAQGLRGGPVRHDWFSPSDGSGSSDLVHVTFTDHLFGPDPDAAVKRILGLLDGRPLSLNLHDIPQVEEGAQRFDRRRRAYEELAGIASIVVVNSDHEARAVKTYPAGQRTRLEVVPLPLEAPAGPSASRQRVSDRGQAPPIIGLMGFVYPGKGYERVIHSAPEGASIRAIGSVVAGHEGYAQQLSAAAARRGIGLEITGFVPDSRLSSELAQVTVPVCPHLHASASGSLNTWIAHGRRPIVLEGPYMQEIAQRWPGSLSLCRPETLGQHLVRGIQDPGYTRAWRPLPQWGWAEVASAYTRIWRGVQG
ncbi:glycosyltransferase family 4 protein [Kocuria coralli]|uniref:Glycosyltransferase family 4 protein n=1 Tax=Kocuria coralli TaxID=1461025 RepID=A0A5J5KYP1_9MICC|nr:glycosyltransferase family 4 protein [Kocuria coralli]KAA9393881.1 glycosyltransferase family 4 protein [Kocuria coralli]